MYTFAADSEKLDKLASDLRGQSSSVGTDITLTYDHVHGFGTYWSGESYDSFAEGCDAYKGALKTIPEVLEDFATTFETAAGGVPVLQSEVESAMNSIS